MRITLGSVPVDVIDMNQTVEQIGCAIAAPREQAFHICTPNAQFVLLAHRISRFREALAGADLSVADGVPLVWASRLLGYPLPGRVNGTDLMVRLCGEAASHAWSVYFLGGRPGAAESAARRLAMAFPNLRIAGVDCPTIGFMDDPDLDFKVSARIEEASPDLLFVALGAPKQEYWIRQHLLLPAKVMIGVGGSFELVAGVVRRAPSLFQRVGCEWLWRLSMEPRRLWRRYLIGNAWFVFVVLRQALISAQHVNCDDRN